MRISEIQKEIHHTAVEKGWWDDTPETPLRTFGDCIALIHSEASEALEEFRNGYSVSAIYYNNESPKPEGVPVELADIVIRVLDLAARHNINMERAMSIKMEYNKTRPVRHGGKKL